MRDVAGLNGWFWHNGSAETVLAEWRVYGGKRSASAPGPTCRG